MAHVTRGNQEASAVPCSGLSPLHFASDVLNHVFVSLGTQEKREFPLCPGLSEASVYLQRANMLEAWSPMRM